MVFGTEGFAEKFVSVAFFASETMIYMKSFNSDIQSFTEFLHYEQQSNPNAVLTSVALEYEAAF